MTLAFTKATKADITFLLRLRKLSMQEHLNNAGIKMNDVAHLERITEHFSDSNIIHANQQAIGLLKLGVTNKSIHIRQFQILPDFHNKGIGSQVLNMVKNKALQMKMPITLNVLLLNPAKKLYLKHGFEITSSDEFQHKMIYSP